MKIIAIGGCSGSGKSTLARALRMNIAGSTAIALDSYYANRGPIANYDHPDALDWPLLDEHLDALAGGLVAQVPVYDFETHSRTDAVEIVAPGPVVIVEGILALHHAGLRERSHLKIYVEAASDQCLDRRIERDVAERGRTHESVVEQYRTYTAPMAAEYVLPSRTFADLVVSGERPVEEALATITQFLTRG